MNEMDFLSTANLVAQESTKIQFKVAPKAAPDLAPESCGLMIRTMATILGMLAQRWTSRWLTDRVSN